MHSASRIPADLNDLVAPLNVVVAHGLVLSRVVVGIGTVHMHAVVLNQL